LGEDGRISGALHQGMGSISRPDRPSTSVATDANLMFAPSNVFCRRFTSALRSRTKDVR
jgi:hypothetical protein